MLLSKEKEAYFKKLYYSPSSPAGFGGIDALYRVVKEKKEYKITRRQIEQWLETQDTYTLHHPVRIHFKRNPVIAEGIDSQWQIDLVDVQSLAKYNDNYRFLLTCVDIFSRYAWVEPLKNKTGVATVEAFKRILNSKRKPATVQADKGTEFLNKSFQSFLKQRGIKFFTTYSEMKAAYVERFNRTLKTKMWKYFTYKNTLRYIDILPELVAAYNHSYHRSIGTTPSKVTSGNENKIWRKLYGKKVKNRLNAVKYRLQVGDQVRISKERRVFKKSYLPSWTEEIFTVAKGYLEALLFIDLKIMTGS